MRVFLVDDVVKVQDGGSLAAIVDEFRNQGRRKLGGVCRWGGRRQTRLVPQGR